MTSRPTALSVFVSTTPFGAYDRAPVDWLAATGWNVRINDTGRKLTPGEVADMARDCDGIVAGTEDLNPLLDTNPHLKVISRVGVGLDSVPLQRCRDRAIAVAYTPDAVTPAVAEFAIGAMLTACRAIALSDRQVRRGKWIRHQGIRIGTSCVGIVGFGRIGSAVGRLLTNFRPVELLVCDILDKRREIDKLVATGVHARTADLGEFLETSDIVSLHVPLRPSNRNLIGTPEFDRMKPGAYLVNAARGGIVSEHALVAALTRGRLAGAAVDVYETEPYSGPLAELKNVVLTAHMGSCSVDCRAKMERDATADLIRFFRHGILSNPVPDDEYDNQI